MFLKSLEIRGFKSFADKTELKFKKGVTAVVGPNGSGKSNISDSVRWVLGEQSVKTLRGGKMEDVIFAGTQFRKPVGLAQVSLTLDNSDKELGIDFSDVTVTRRIYRSGESEYLINNSVCRLKDITQLFMDTGIGKEGYSLIGQGKIDAILSGKAEERRALLEEAAGIVKYKSRKDEAEKKLSNTEENLVRINDILSTYEERIEPLRIDSEKAAKFLELSNELKSREIDLLVYHIKSVEHSIKTYNSELIEVKNKSNSLREEISKAKSKLSEHQNEIEVLEGKTTEERIEYYKSKENITELNAEINLLVERIANIDEQVRNNNKEKTIITDKIENLINLQDKLALEVESKKQELLDLQFNIYELEKDANIITDEITENEDKVGKLKLSEIEEYKRIAELENEKKIIENTLESLSTNLLEIEENSVNLKNSSTINANTKILLDEKLEEHKKSILELEEKIRLNKKEISRIQAEIVKKEQEFRDVNSELTRSDATFKMINNLEKHFEGYNKSTKVLMEHMSKGFVGNLNSKVTILGETIQVPKKYEVAIEIALGAGISNIITEDENTAKNLIDYLKSNKLGRATFLPLTIIQGKKINIDNRIKDIPGYIGIASDLVKYDNKYESAIQYSLGRTLIVETMESALKVAKIGNYSYRIVTLTGEVVNPGGALTGGNYGGKNSSIISRKRELEELKEKITSLEERAEVLKKEISEIKEKAMKYDEDNLNKRDEIHFNNIEIAKLQGEIKNIQNEWLKINDFLVTAANQKKEIENRTVELKNKMDSIEKLINDSKSSTFKNKDLIKEIEEKIKDLNAVVIEKRDKTTDFKIKKATIEEVISNRSSEKQRLESEYNEAMAKIQDLADYVKNGNESKILFNEKIVSNKKRIEELTLHINAFDEKWKETEALKASLKEKINTIESEQETLVKLLEKNEDEYHKKEMGKAKFDIEKDSYYTKLNEDLNLTYAEAVDLASEIENLNAHKDEINKFKRDINSLGVVNVSSIEEYKEVKEKFTFMNSQKDDLENAKKDLLDVIDDMTYKMKELFKDNFKILNLYFSETFKELFKGGSAELILGEGDELTANIDINVQPPGKKVQNINLMSGGEKVMSAIALLFAILKMKPTPFCILDEIEAALDDANVYRYAEFLKKFSSNIQFIVITHRKGTMEASDIMYGVTMEEKGVSKVVSVNLEN
ncbi:chromosome segregation protein SMC [Clostridium sp. 'White wine YQ']|uniref:chromosome segregation protein SMC n=1 Tax=Clostridium sp. 'White wine YQ' TaxID=3027474 RepID=UPI002366992E|nr:chromosome segregation protein SMC [Clostridium sp. 'White wine YQ']MDD7793766.1 chromosome segregation protein SMC [Clostridium sp. 'White wine YQ']